MSQNQQLQGKSAFGALMVAIKSLCSLLIDLFSVAQEGVAMADKAVKSARERQGVEIELTMADYKTVTVYNSALQVDTARQKLIDYVGGDQAKHDRINKDIERLTKIAEEELARIRASRQ